MDLKELEDHVAIMLRQLLVSNRKLNITRNVSTQFMVDDFGIIVCCINRVDYSEVSNKIFDLYKDWRVVFITTNDSILDKKYEVIWALMRGGYMKWLRYKYPRQIKSVLCGTENLGTLIINKRLEVWANKPKFNYLIEDNKVALINGISRELTNDPSFFDYMPEED